MPDFDRKDVESAIKAIEDNLQYSKQRYADRLTACLKEIDRLKEELGQTDLAREEYRVENAKMHWLILRLTEENERLKERKDEAVADLLQAKRSGVGD